MAHRFIAPDHLAVIVGDGGEHRRDHLGVGRQRDVFLGACLDRGDCGLGIGLDAAGDDWRMDMLGRSRMDVSELLRLGPGAVLELDRKVGEAIDIYVNNRLVARGEVVLVEDKLGVTMTEIIKADKG
jgi:flagellar motor switch protein FliN